MQKNNIISPKLNKKILEDDKLSNSKISCKLNKKILEDD